MFTDSVPYTFVFLAYMPYGEEWVDIRNNGYFGSAYKFNGKEKDEETGYNYYGARYYTDRLSIFLSVDRFADKFPWQSSYCYAGNNPIGNIDVNGDSVIVSNSADRDALNKDLVKIFGNNASNFKYSDRGSLLFNGTTKGMSAGQKKALKIINKLISQKDDYLITYRNDFTIDINGVSKTYDIVKDCGGEGYFSKQRTIVVSPNAGNISVQLDDMYVEGVYQGGYPFVDVEENTTSLLFHGMGEALVKDPNYRGKVIDYENIARKLLGMKKRPYDLNHSNTLKTEYKK